MKNLGRIKEMLKEDKERLKKQFKVKEIGIFGSYVRREEDKESDIDILVEFEGVVDFFDFLELEEHLSDILNVKVDLVMRRALKPRIGENILKEVIYA